MSVKIFCNIRFGDILQTVFFGGDYLLGINTVSNAAITAEFSMLFIADSTIPLARLNII